MSKSAGVKVHEALRAEMNQPEKLSTGGRRVCWLCEGEAVLVQRRRAHSTYRSMHKRACHLCNGKGR